ncbi:MAG: WD40 repeat domain-containing protein [Chloroflexota bacterium]
MRKNSIYSIVLLLVFVLGTLVLSACGGEDQSAPPVENPAVAAPTNPPAVAPTNPPAAAPTVAPAAANSGEQAPAALAMNSIAETSHWGKGRIQSLAYSPDGKTLVVATALGLYFYDTTSWSERFVDTSGQSMYIVTFSPDGTMLAIGESNGGIVLRQVSDGKLVREMGTTPDDRHKNTVTSLAFSPDGQNLISGSDDLTVRFWKVSDGSLAQKIEEFFSTRINSIAFSPDKSTIAIATQYPDNKIYLWKMGEDKASKVLAEHKHSVYDVAFSPDGSLLASGSLDGSIRVWKVGDGSVDKVLIAQNQPAGVPTPIPTIDPNYSPEMKKSIEDAQKIQEENKMPYVFSVAFSPDGQTVAGGYFDNVIRLWKISDGSLFKTLEGSKSMVFDVTYSPDGTAIAARSVDGFVRIWQASEGALLKAIDFGYAISTLAISPDGNNLAIGGEAYQVIIKKLSDASVVMDQTPHVNRVTSVTYSSDGKLFADASIDGVIVTWNLADGKVKYIFPVMGPIYSVAISPDNQILAAATGDNINSIALWNLSDGKVRSVLKGHTAPASVVAFSADGTMLVSAGEDSSVRLWFVQDGKQLKVLEGQKDVINSAAFSPNGELLATGSLDNTVQFYKMPSGEVDKTIKLLLSTSTVAFSKDGNLLAVGLSDGSVAIYKYNENIDSPYVVLDGNKEEVTSIIFTQDGKIITGGRDGTIRFWTLK